MGSAPGATLAPMARAVARPAGRRGHHACGPAVFIFGWSCIEWAAALQCRPDDAVRETCTSGRYSGLRILEVRSRASALLTRGYGLDAQRYSHVKLRPAHGIGRIAAAFVRVTEAGECTSGRLAQISLDYSI